LPTGVDDDPTALPRTAHLAQNYPNPFNPTTIIEFTLPRSTQVELSVYNILGQRVVVLIDRAMRLGRHTVTFDGSHLASGVYLYRLKTSDRTTTRKMVLMK
jgi:hypothetical protein